MGDVPTREPYRINWRCVAVIRDSARCIFCALVIKFRLLVALVSDKFGQVARIAVSALVGHVLNITLWQYIR